MSVFQRFSETRQHFRILQDWVFTDGNNPQYFASINVHPSESKVVIYPYGDGEPDDYVLHELLHICILALHRIKKNESHATYRESEEQFVQDVCQLYSNRPGGQMKGSECLKILGGQTEGKNNEYGN